MSLRFRFHAHGATGDHGVSLRERDGAWVCTAELAGRECSEELSADEVASLLRDLDEIDVWTLSDRGDIEQEAGQQWHTVEVWLPPRHHRVRYYGEPSARHEAFNDWVETGLVGRALQRLRGLEPGEKADLSLWCPACAEQGFEFAIGAVTCPRHHATLLRVDVAGRWTCATCSALCPQRPRQDRCPHCNRPIAY